MGDVGAVATLLNDIFKYAVDPSGYAQDSLERKLEKLHEASKQALADKDWGAVDRLVAEYRRLSASI